MAPEGSSLGNGGVGGSWAWHDFPCAPARPRWEEGPWQFSGLLDSGLSLSDFWGLHGSLISTFQESTVLPPSVISGAAALAPPG